MKFIKKILLLSIFLISNINVIFASSNILINNTDKKELEINEKYDEKLNITVNDIKIEDISNNNIKITGNINLIHDINSNGVIVPYNIKKSINETYNLNDIYIMAFSSIKSNINVYWHREITDNKNIGKGYIKNNENIIIDREYGTGDDKTIQNEEIYTNNELINKIAGTNLLNSISIDNNNNNVIFEIIIDKNKITKMRYLYITTINDIIKNNNNITYKNLLSDYIDLFEYYDAYKNIEIINTSATNNQLFGETPITSNYTFYKAAEELYKREQHPTSSSGNGNYINKFYYTKNNGFYIKDEHQNKATPSILDIKMTQDDDYYFFNIKINYNSNVPYNSSLMIGNNEYQDINNGTLYLSNQQINDLSYNYTISYPHFENYLGWYKSFYSTSNYEYRYEGASIDTSLSNHFNGITRNDSLNMKINDYNGIQSMKLSIGGTLIDKSATGGEYSNSIFTTFTPTSNIADSTKTPSLIYCSLVFPFEKYLNGESRHSPLYNMGGYGITPRVLFANDTLYQIYMSAINSKIDYILNNKIMFNNSQSNFLIPIKPNYNCIENINITKDSLKNYWNNNFESKIKIKKSDINNYRFLNMYASSAVIKSKSNSWWSYNQSYSDTSGANTYTWTSPEAKQVAYSIHSSEAIDLLPYSNCEHNWVIGDIIDENQHYAYCTKCEWRHKENHNFEYEYDGLNNNLCACGFNHSINHHYVFNSNLISDYDEVVLASSSYIRNNNPVKTGYRFKNFDKYLKYFENMVNPVFSVASTSIIDTYIGEVASMSEISDRFTTTYKANYEPIKYYVHFNSNNNMNLPINIDSISDMTCLYDNDYNPPIISYAGYTFKGWTLASGSNTIDISKHGKIKNLTTIENRTIDVYPVFDIFTYKFSFSEINNVNKVIISTISDLVCERDIHYNLPDNMIITGYNFMGWSLVASSSNVDFIPNQDIYNYTTLDDQEYILYPVYKPIKYKFIFRNENVNNFNLTDTLENEEFTYDEEKEINSGIFVRGYYLVGWSLTATSSEIKFSNRQKILNYTSIDNDTLILYPVYDTLNFSIVYKTTIGNYRNGLQIATISYASNTLTKFEIPNYPIKYEYNDNGSIRSETYLVFLRYTFGNNSFANVDALINYILDRNLNGDLIILDFNGRIKTKKYETTGGAGSFDSGGGSSGTAENATNNINETIEVKEITVKANNKNLKTIKKDVKISKKDLIDLINEVFSDFKDQNNIKNQDIVIYVDYVPYNNQYDIVSFINDIYNDFIDNIDKVNDNQNEDGMVHAFTGTELSTKSTANIKKKKISTSSNVKIIRELNVEKNVASKSVIKSNSFINKIFKNNSDIKNIEEIIEFCNKREFLQVYKNINENKYKDTFNDFITRYDGMFSNIEKELKKSKYKDIDKKIIEIINSEEYKDLKDEIVKISYKYGTKYISFIKDIKSKNINKLIYNFNDGKYKEILNDLIPLLTNSNFLKNVEYELIDGEYSDLAYDLIYNLFDITYNYKVIEKVEETTEAETTTIEITTEETSKEAIDIVNENEIDLISVVPFIAILGILIIIIVFIVKKVLKKKGENEYE